MLPTNTYSEPRKRQKLMISTKIKCVRIRKIFWCSSATWTYCDVYVCHAASSVDKPLEKHLCVMQCAIFRLQQFSMRLFFLFSLFSFNLKRNDSKCTGRRNELNVDFSFTYFFFWRPHSTATVFLCTHFVVLLHQCDSVAFFSLSLSLFFLLDGPLLSLLQRLLHWRIREDAYCVALRCVVCAAAAKTTQ